VQELGLATLYKERDDVHHLCGILDGLAFLPVADIVADAVNELPKYSYQMTAICNFLLPVT
jgi:hypothetical protein